MAGEKTQVEIDAQIDAGIKVNSNKEITPPIHNAIEKALSNSYLNKKDGGLVLQVLAGYTTDLTPSDNKHWTPKKYVDDLIDSEILAFAGTLPGLYYALDGSAPLEGNMDAGGYDIENAGVITALDGFSTDGTPSIFSDTTNNRIYLGEGTGGSATGTDHFFAGSITGLGAAGNNLFGAGAGAMEGANGNNLNGYGYQSLRSSVGSDNNAMGVSSGGNSTSTGCNFFGPLSGYTSNCGNGNFMGNSSGYGNLGARCNGFGYEALNGNTADDVVGMGIYAAKNNTRSNLFTVAAITDVFWNNVGDKGNTTLGVVTIQAAMAPDGTDQSAAASIQKIAPARGTGNADAGYIVIQKANIQASGTTRHTLTDWWFYEANGNHGFGGQSYGSGVGVQFIADATTAPTTNPTGGIVYYSESGVSKYRDPSGNIITV